APAGPTTQAQSPSKGAAPSSSGGLVFGGPAGGTFAVPANIQQGPPDVNTVPTAVPAPKSSKEERTKALVGLIADRQNARHSEQPARPWPVAVRPLSDQPAPKASEAAVAALATPAPDRPADADAPPSEAPPAAASPPGPRSVATLVGPRRRASA